MTKWVEATALVRATDQVVVDVMFEKIFTRFGVPKETVTNGGSQFVSRKVESLLQIYHIQHRINSPCHPQTNGQVESTNKVIEAILTKTVKSHRRDGDEIFPEALWEYRTTWRNTIGFSPYELVYKKNVSSLLNLRLKL